MSDEVIGLMVTAIDGRRIHVSTGSALIQGYWYRNDGSIVIGIPFNETDIPIRIDRVVLQLDNYARVVATTYVLGGATAPPLKQAPGNIWQIPLALVTAVRGDVPIRPEDIINLARRDDDRQSLTPVLHRVVCRVQLPRSRSAAHDRHAPRDRWWRLWIL